MGNPLDGLPQLPETKAGKRNILPGTVSGGFGAVAPENLTNRYQGNRFLYAVCERKKDGNYWWCRCRKDGTHHGADP